MLSRIVLACCLAAAIGCGKPSAPPPPAPASEPAASPPAAAATSDAAADEAVPDPAPQDEAQLAAALAELTQLVRRFGAEQRRVPTTLNELVTQGYLGAVPQAPEGKRFAINARLEVYLENQPSGR